MKTNTIIPEAHDASDFVTKTEHGEKWRIRRRALYQGTGFSRADGRWFRLSARVELVPFPVP
jgi:hypothetical protein